jgi:nitroreductase
MSAAATNLEYFLTSTRSARKSLDLNAPVDMAAIGECLEIGLHAANGSNQQTWRWIVVSDAALKVEIAKLYRDAYRSMTGEKQTHEGFGNSEFGRLMSSTEWLVEHLGEVPLLVIPCYEPWLPRTGENDSFYCATMYGSIFPAVWNFQVALHARGYGTCITTLHLHREKEIRALLGIPENCIQGCLLPVARLRAGHRFRTTPRRPLAEVAVLDRWNGPSMVSSVIIARKGETAMALNADTKLGDLLDNPEAEAVLLKHVPEISSAGPMLNMARAMTLKMVAGFPQANISAEKLQAIVGDLEKL